MPCNAKTRAGTPCKRSPMFFGRCNLHGGKSLSGIAHPGYKHGFYSKYLPYRALVLAARQRQRSAESSPHCSQRATAKTREGGSQEKA
ncbi:MAG TPA: HGGxSTG domain-containing protein [Chloroflexia bacterium]